MRTWELRRHDGALLQQGFAGRSTFAVEGVGRPAVFPTMDIAEVVAGYLWARDKVSIDPVMRQWSNLKDTMHQTAQVSSTGGDTALLTLNLTHEERKLLGLNPEEREVSNGA